MEKIYLTIVIPCYNEERNIRLGALEIVAHFLKKKPYSYEVLIVDDGSTDESKKLINEFLNEHSAFRLITKEHQGKGATVMTGTIKANGDYILFTDLDQATPITQIDKLLPFFEKGYDIVIGSRSDKRKGAPLLRRTMAKGFIILRNIILNLGIQDTQCGFKAYSKAAAHNIFSRLHVYNLTKSVSRSTVTAGFDVEFLFLAKKYGYRIAEVSVDWNYQETRHVNPLKDSWEGLMDLIKIRWNSLQGVYD